MGAAAPCSTLALPAVPLLQELALCSGDARGEGTGVGHGDPQEMEINEAWSIQTMRCSPETVQANQADFPSPLVTPGLFSPPEESALGQLTPAVLQPADGQQCQLIPSFLPAPANAFHPRNEHLLSS